MNLFDTPVVGSVKERFGVPRGVSGRAAGGAGGGGGVLLRGRRLLAVSVTVGLVASLLVGAAFEGVPERMFSERVTAEELQAQVLEGAAATDKSSAIQFLRGQGYSQAEARQIADEIFDDPNSSLLTRLFGGDSENAEGAGVQGESAEGTGALPSSLSGLSGSGSLAMGAPLAMSAPLAAAPRAMSAPVGTNRLAASLPMDDPADPAADPNTPGSSSGTQITRFELQWQSADDVDNGDPDLLYRKPSGDSLSDAVLQLVYGVQGERDYEPGEFTITIPAKNFTLRDVSTGEDAGKAGSLTIPYPEDPRKTKDFSWKLIGDNYVITNTRTLSAATKGYIELAVSYPGYVHNLRDMAKHDFQAHLEVVGPDEEVLSEDSNVVQMQVDSHQQITSLRKTTPVNQSLTPVDASQIPEAQRIPGEEKYYVVEWTLRVAHQGNQPYQLNLTDTISDEYGGFILEATDSSGRKLEKNVFEGWSAPSSDQYFYVKTAYPASQIDTSDRTCGIRHVYATVRNSATMKLTPFDRVDSPTSASAFASTQWSYYKNCPYFSAVTGNVHMCKYGNDGEKYGFSHQGNALNDCPGSSTKVGGNYVTALNRLRDGADVQIDYDMNTRATLLPWTRDGNERVLADYGKKNVTLVWTDTGVQMLNEQGVKAGRDFDFTSVSISKPSIGKAYSSGLNADGSFIEDWDDPRRYIDVASDTNPANIPVIVLEAKVGAKWQKVADVDYTSGSCQVQYANGSTSTDCAHIVLPERTTQFRTSVTTNVASISYTVRPKVTLYATDAMRQLAAQSFEDTRMPVRHMRNNATLVATGEDGSKIATLNRFGEDNLWGYSAESEVKLEKKARQKSVNYNDGYVTLGYTATGVERWDAPDVVSDYSQERLWNELVEIGELEPLPSGVWYDLLPQGVYPILNSVTVNTEVSDGNGRKVTTPGTIAGVRTVPDWQGTGRMMLIVDMDYPQEKYSGYKRNGFQYYEQPISISFDARYDFDSIKDYGKNTHNVIAFEAGKDTYGSIDGRRGEEDTTSGSNHTDTAAAFKDDVERGALNNLNPDHDNPVFVYAGVSQAVSALSAANTGLDKKVMANNDGIWGAGTYGEDVDVWEGGTYSYRLRLTSGNETISKDLILYDSLENFYAGASNDEVDIDAPRWNGTFKSIDVSSLEAKGVKPVVYYSTVPNLRLDDANNPKLPNAQNVDLTNSAVWSTTAPSDLSKVTAIAIDASKKTDGSDFELQPKESISVVMRMVAPSGDEGARAVEENAHAYNNAFMVATSIDATTGEADEKSFVRHDYTKVGIKEFSLDVTKQWDDDNNRDGIRPAEVIVHLLANGSDTGESLTLNAENNWQGRFEHLIHDDDSGAMIEYAVQEEQVAGYTSRTSVAGQKMTIRNTHTPERISLSGTKTWANASADVLPASISVVLYADGKVAQRKTVKPDASGKWKYEFANLNKYRDGGQEIVYTLGEQNIGEDWISRVEGMNIVNTYHPYGDALVSKVVRGAPERYADTEFTFKLSLLDSSGKALAGSYAFETSDGRTGTIKHGSTFRLKDGQSLRIKELPKGTVVRSVENALPAGSMFEIVGSSEQSTTVKSNAEVTATHTNAFTAGDAVISKQVEGVPEAYAAKYADMDFSFKVSLLNGETPVSGSFEFETSDGRTGTIKHGDTVTLKGGQSLRIKELPKGVTVRSEEALPAGFAFENNGVQEKPVKAGAVVTLGHVNEYRFGDAVLSKRLEGVPERYAAKYAEADFSFKVSLLDGENPVSGSFEFETSDGRTGTVKHGDTVTLKGGQSLRIKELPKGVTVRSEEALPADSVFTPNSDGAYVGVVAASQDVPLESVNTYNRSDAVLSKKVENATGVTGTLDFSFTISLLDSEDNVLTGQYEWESSDGRTGKIAHNGTLTLKDGQSVRIKELPMGAVVRTEEADMPGFTAQGGTVKSATVKANEDAQIAYTNTYSAVGRINLEASKSLTGQPLRNGQFVFEVYDADGKLLRAASNNGEGQVTFGALSYTQADAGKTYTYTIKEKNAGAGGITYDGREYQARVTVNDNGDGTMSPTVEYVGLDAGATKPQFANVYHASGEAALKAWKELDGRELKAGEFSFDLLDANNNVVQTKTNAADGTISFDPLQFNETQVGQKPLYVIRERAGTDSTVVYDTESVFGYQLEVVDQRDGTLGFNLTKVGVKQQGGVWVSTGETDDVAVFENSLQPGGLSVEKRTTDGSSNEPFRFKVKLTGKDVPENGTYNYDLSAVESLPVNSIVIDELEVTNGRDVQIDGYNGSGWSGEWYYWVVNGNVPKVTDVFPEYNDNYRVESGTLTSPSGKVYTCSNLDEYGREYNDVMCHIHGRDGSFEYFGFEHYENAYDGVPRFHTYTTGGSLNSDDEAGLWTWDFKVTDGEKVGYGSVSYLNYNVHDCTYDRSIGKYTCNGANSAGTASATTGSKSAVIARSANPVSSSRGGASSADAAISSGTNAGLAKPSIFASLHSALSAKLPTIGLKTSDDTNSGDVPLTFGGVPVTFDKETGVLTIPDGSTLTVEKTFDGVIPVGATSPGDWWTGLEENGIKLSDIKTVKGKNIVLETGAHMFAEWTYLSDISDLATWNVSSVTDMSHMFQRTHSLPNLKPLATWNVSNVKDMSYMFAFISEGRAFTKNDYLKGLETWDVSNVERFSFALFDAQVYDMTPLSQWKFSLEHVGDFFREPGKIMYLDVSGWNTDRPLVFYYPFDHLQYLKVGENTRLTEGNFSAYLSPSQWLHEETGEILPALEMVQRINSGNGAGTWKRQGINKVTFSFAAGEGAVGSRPSETMDTLGHRQYSVPDATGFSRPGYDFAGWKSDTPLSGHRWDSDSDTLHSNIDGVNEYLQPGDYMYLQDFSGTVIRDATGKLFLVGKDSLEGMVLPMEIVQPQVTLTAQWTPRDTSITMENGEFEFTLRGGEKATFNNIPAGTAYEVYEMTEKGWVLVDSTGTSGVIKPTETSRASFTNRPVEGVTSVRVEATKLLDGVGAEAGEFNFRLTDGTNTQDVSNGAGGAIAFPQILVWDDSSMTEAQMLARTPANVRENAFAIYPASALPKNLTISEVAGESAGIAYDNRSITATLNMGEGGNPVVTYNRAPVFENTTKPASLQVTKNVENAPANDASEFSVRVELVNENNVPLADTSAITGKVDGSLISLDWADGATTVKLHGGQSLMLEGIPAGAGYTVSETDMPRGWAQTALTGGTGTLEAGQTATASVTNTYGASGKLNLEAYKSLVGRELEEDEFEFELLDPSGNVIATAENTYPDIRTQIADDDGNWTPNPHKGHGWVGFDNIAITKAGTYTYTIREKNTGDTTVNYDGRTVTATVTATDNGNGTLSFDVSYSGGKDGANLFENEVVPLHMWLKKTIDNASDVPAEYKDALFLYRVKLSGDTDLTVRSHDIVYRLNGAVTTDGVGGEYRPATWTGSEMVIGVRAGEEVQLAYFPTGTRYEVQEIGWVIGGVRHELGDTFSYVSGEHMSGAIEGDKATRTAHATNHYTEPETPPDTPPTPQGKTAKVTIKAHKVAENYTLQGEDFTFELVDFDGNVIDTAKNTASGEIAFGEITLSEADLDKVHTYYIREQVSENASGRWQYDEKNHKVDIVTEKNEDGELIATVYYDTDEEPTFTNTYIEPVGYLALRADKEVTGEGAELAEGDFTFELRDSIGHTIATATNEADGSVWFPTITYGAADVGKTYTYQIVEIAGDKAGWTYDEHVETVSVTVTDTGAALLDVNVTYDVGADFTADPATADSDTDTTFGALFVNSYEFDPPVVGVRLAGGAYVTLVFFALAGALGGTYIAARRSRQSRL